MGEPMFKFLRFQMIDNSQEPVWSDTGLLHLCLILEWLYGKIMAFTPTSPFHSKQSQAASDREPLRGMGL